MKQFNSVLLIYNPNAMKGKIDEFVPHIKQRLLLRFPIVEVMSSPEVYGAESIAFKNAPKFDIVLACGGDGTLDQFVNRIYGEELKCTVYFYPCGSGNDFARDFNGNGKLIDITKEIYNLPKLRINDEENFVFWR